MRKKLTIGVVSAIFVIVLINSVFAQPRARRFRAPKPIQPVSAIGIRLGNDFENDQYLAGAHFWLPMGIFWKFLPGFEYYITDRDFKRWQFNADFIFKPRPRSAFYFGGGVAAQYLTSIQKQEFGGNVLLGLDFGGPRRPVYPYVQARWTFFEKEDYFSFLGGINLILK